MTDAQRTMQPIQIAVKGKGALGMLKRARTIHARYGITAAKMAQILADFVEILHRFDCGATFPITTVALARSRRVIERYAQENIEFAVHGYTHVDHSQLSLDQQLAHFSRAREIFTHRGMAAEGLRCPYLRWSEVTLDAAARSGFLYDGSQALVWDVVPDQETESYRHVLGFYGAVPASCYPALPRMDDALIRIPYCLPDDEALVDRLCLSPSPAMTEPWLAILAETYALGELFTLGLHPERIHGCQAALAETLRAARALRPHVWISRLDDVARWWRDRARACVTVSSEQGAVYRVQVEGPPGTTLLARGVEPLSATARWDERYVRAAGSELRVAADVWPVIGVSPDSAPALTRFLRQQGYIIEEVKIPDHVGYYLHRPTFGPEDERALLREIEEGDFPLVRLGRWPDGARSALVVTGDIDALTIWDYGLRFLGN